MTGRIIRLQGDCHQDVQLLLPWYVTGSLDGAEHALVEAHLSQCPECLAELRFEHRLDREVAELPIEAERGWAALQLRLAASSSSAASPLDAIGAWLASAWRRTRRAWRASPPWLGWAMAAQSAAMVAAALLVVMVLAVPRPQTAAYHALGAAPVAASGNVVVIFRPDTSERDLRAALNLSHARLVDGPTSTDAYVLHVPAAERAADLTALRRRPSIVLAEPIDAGGAP